MAKEKIIEVGKDPQKISEMKKEMSQTEKRLYFLVNTILGNKGFDKFSASLYSFFLKQAPNQRKQFPRVFIIHGWGGNPEEAWMPWLKKQLEISGIEVHVLAMPDTANP